MDIDTEAVDEVVLALLYLNLCDQNRAWKSFIAIERTVHQ
jgi:hypothetical protein